MSKRRLVWPMISLVAVGGALAIAWFVRARENQTAVRAVLPPVPSLSTWPAELKKRIIGADAEARSFFWSHRGLAELSRLYHANGFLTEAGSCYKGLTWMDDNEPRWRHLHAMIQAGFGEMDSAIGLERRAVELSPDYIPARLRLGDLLLKNNQTEEAVRTYQQVLARDADEPYAQLGLARAEFDAGAWEKARQRLEPLVEQTNFQLGYDLVVTVYERLGLKERAAQIRGFGKTSGAFRDPADPWLDELSAFCFDPYRLGVLSVNAERAGDLDRAMELAERGLQIKPNDVSTLFQLGNLCRRKKEFSRARMYLEACTKVAPTFADGWAHLSSLLTQLQEPVAAEKILGEGLRNCPESPGLHLMRARSLVQAGRKEDAIGAYRESTRLRFNEADAFIELALLLFGVDRVDEGMAEVEKSLVAEPENPKALGLMAYHAVLSGNERSARRWLKRVCDQPRVPREEREALKQAYERNFGRPWNPVFTGP